MWKGCRAFQVSLDQTILVLCNIRVVSFSSATLSFYYFSTFFWLLYICSCKIQLCQKKYFILQPIRNRHERKLNEYLVTQMIPRLLDIHFEPNRSLIKLHRNKLNLRGELLPSQNHFITPSSSCCLFRNTRQWLRVRARAYSNKNYSLSRNHWVSGTGSYPTPIYTVNLLIEMLVGRIKPRL